MSSTKMEVEALGGEVVAAGGELVVADGLALTAEGIGAAERQIVALRESDDWIGLDDARVRMETWRRAAQLHERYAEMLRPIARLKILVEASIGLMDLEACGWAPSVAEPLSLPSGEVERNRRKDWRILGVAQHRGLLAAALDATDDHSSQDVVRLLRRRGAAWVDPAVVERAWRDSGMNLAAVSLALGLKRKPSRITLFGHGTKALGYAKAVRIAAVLGVSPDEWPPFRPRSWGSPAAVGRAAAARRALQEKERNQAIKRAVRKQGGAMAELYAMAERMQDVMGQAHREATDSQAREALSLAGTHYRKMRDEIVRALGVL